MPTQISNETLGFKESKYSLNRKQCSMVFSWFHWEKGVANSKDLTETWFPHLRLTRRPAELTVFSTEYLQINC